MVDRTDPMVFDTSESSKVRGPALLFALCFLRRASLSRHLSAVPADGQARPQARARAAGYCVKDGAPGLRPWGWGVQGVGIHAMEVYFPRTAVKQTELEK
jgi:hypothetical protein